MRQGKKGGSLWRLWGSIEAKYQLSPESRVVVVLGYPRSGTSIVSRMVEAAGVSFGDKHEWRKADSRNPKGFYEYADVIEIDHDLVRQSGLPSPFSIPLNHEFRATTAWNRIRRLFTRRRMLQHIKTLSSFGNMFAIKEFPLTFHFWLPYLPKPKVVAVFRHPAANAASIMHAFKRMTFTQALESWTFSNAELLYHVGAQDSILISMEDLRDPSRREDIVKGLIRHLGAGDMKTILGVLDEYSVKDSETTLVKYPLPERTERIYQELLRRKI